MTKIVRYQVLTVVLLLFYSFSQAQMRITEFMYNGTNKEFVEFTNVGSTPIDMTGWSYDDASRTAGSFSLSAFNIVQPGESVILAENTEAAFRTAWGLCSGVKVIGGSTQNLGRADEINLYDAGGAQVDRLSYDDQNISGTFQTNNISAWVTAAGLGANDVKLWGKSVNPDSENSFTSANGEVGSPGKSTRATVAYTPC